jgi:thiamine-monophosphate kinase
MPASEFDLIAAINDCLPLRSERVRIPSGDDAAVVEPLAATAVSVDAVVDGVHFNLERFGPRAVGRKALAAALSDLAAMGATPGEAYVSLGAPSGMEDGALLGIADGLAEVAARESVTIGGGDLVSSPTLFVSVTAVGYETGDAELVTRAGAKPGDLIGVTGELGGAAAALELLEPSGAKAEISTTLREQLLSRQLDPRPRLDEGHALAETGAMAMIDISDGLGADASHVASASGCRIEIDLDKAPVAEGVAEVAGGEGAGLELAAGGGEDYELLAAIPVEDFARATAAVREAGGVLTEIGYVAEGQGVALRLPGGRKIQPSGFDQRRGSLSGSG